eukprot:Opistho-1_new@96522
MAGRAGVAHHLGGLGRRARPVEQRRRRDIGGHRGGTGIRIGHGEPVAVDAAAARLQPGSRRGHLPERVGVVAPQQLAVLLEVLLGGVAFAQRLRRRHAAAVDHLRAAVLARGRLGVVHLHEELQFDPGVEPHARHRLMRRRAHVPLHLAHRLRVPLQVLVQIDQGAGDRDALLVGRQQQAAGLAARLQELDRQAAQHVECAGPAFGPLLRGFVREMPVVGRALPGHQGLGAFRAGTAAVGAALHLADEAHGAPGINGGEELGHRASREGWNAGTAGGRGRTRPRPGSPTPHARRWLSRAARPRAP